MYDLLGMAKSISSPAIYECFLKKIDTKIGFDTLLTTLGDFIFKDNNIHFKKSYLKMTYYLIYNRADRFQGKNIKTLYIVLISLIKIWDVLLAGFITLTD